MYASTRDWSSLYGTMRSESETAAQSSCSHFESLWEHSGCLSSACIVVCAVNFTVTPAENFVSPLSESSSSPRKHRKKKVSVATRQSVHPSERSPTLPSSSSRLCVRQIENEQQSTVGEVSQLLEVMVLASRLASPDNAVPSLPGSDSWLSKKKQKNSGACSLSSYFYILDVVGTFWIWSSTNDACQLRRAPLFDCVTCAIYSRSVYATSQRHGL